LFEVLVEPQARWRSCKQARQRRLAHGEWIAPHVLTVELDQIEHPHEHVRVMAPIADALERCDAIFAARYRSSQMPQRLVL
jgi:hypothetical protein